MQHAECGGADGGLLPGTPLPLRFQLQSHDRLCQTSLELEWTDERGERQSWSSWDDALAGCYAATKLLPCTSWDISVSFRSQPGKQRLARVDRQRGSRWVKGEHEVIRLRTSMSGPEDWEEVDAWFEVAGPLTRSYVRRAWNARNAGRPAEWEAWPDFSKRRAALPPPSTLLLAGRQALLPSDSVDGAERVELAMKRLRASCEALRITRQRLLVVLKELEASVTRQWYKVNSGNTVAAGLAVASFSALCVTAPPVGMALGFGSAAAGVGTLSKDVLGDHTKGSAFSRAVYEDMYEQFGFDSVEAELSTVLASVEMQSQRASRFGASSKSRNVGGAFAAAAQTLNIVELCARGSLRAGRIALTMRASEGIGMAGRVLGGVGSAIAVGVAIHGWSTKKPMQKLLKEKIVEVERSVEYLRSFEDQVDRAWRCSLCEEPIGFGADSSPVSRCRQFHCFHSACLSQSGVSPTASSPSSPPKCFKRGSDSDLASDATTCTPCTPSPSGFRFGCPLCEAEDAEALKALGGSSDRLAALLRVLGLRGASGLESLAPNLLDQGVRLANRLVERAAQWQDQGRQAREALWAEISRDEASPSAGSDRTEMAPRKLTRSKSAEELPEDLDPELHEAWQDAIRGAGSAACLPKSELDQLLSTGSGMPLRHRHALWPLWLRVDERREDAAFDGCCFEQWAATELPQAVEDLIDADVPRTRREFVPPSQYPELRRLLVAVSARSPHIGYAQGMNQLAAVLLKLGFQGDVAFWMFVAMLDDLLPDCHAPDLSGLFRDTAATEVLLQALLPRHAKVIPASGLDLLLVTADFFLTLGVKNAPLMLVARLWDIYFFYGPRGVFAGLLAQLELFLPVPASANPADAAASPGSACEEPAFLDTDGVGLLAMYREAGFLAGSRDAAMVVTRAMDLLHDDRRGGIPEHLVAELRASMEQPLLREEATPGQALAPPVAPAAAVHPEVAAEEGATEEAAAVGLAAPEGGAAEVAAVGLAAPEEEDAAEVAVVGLAAPEEPPQQGRTEASAVEEVAQADVAPDVAASEESALQVGPAALGVAALAPEMSPQQILLQVA